ncbi:PAQR family membrane homeostasis protein TrhA [Halomonas koreensis]|uniref:Hemolysin III family protein n=1 Tax=Halomonas koreensis TaxID=245385 RepID=A0ABU1G1Y3_9GAMM|nr:hemolysin III family protein [Halomonas koreensis]MDR5866936.1 hemolysin III family protein [Halomonas koreensis]
MSRSPIPDPDYSLLEEILHSASHGLGAALSLAGTAVLLVLAGRAASPDLPKAVALGLYGATLVLLYTASSLYHGVRRPRLKRALQTLDHCAIYALIAGTYTPFLLVNLRASVGPPLLAAVWGLAVAGIALRLWHPRSRGHLAGYLGLGWLILVAAEDMAAALSPAGLGLLTAGGLSYSVGTLFFAIRAIPFNHALWHLCVLGGSGCHYAAVVTEVLPYPG